LWNGKLLGRGLWHALLDEIREFAKSKTAAKKKIENIDM
jgi:hypothetical protein